MSLPDKLQAQRAITEWRQSLAGELFEQVKADWKSYWLSQAATSEYAAVVAANKCQALDDLTNSLDAFMSVEAEETPQEAAIEPKTSGRKSPIRSLPQTI